MKQKPAGTKGFQVGKIWLGTGRAIVRLGNAKCEENHQPGRDGEICNSQIVMSQMSHPYQED